MKGQVSFEALINVGLLAVILGLIVWSVDAKTSFLAGALKKNVLESACNKLRGALAVCLLEPNTTSKVFFDSSFNLSFDSSPGFTVSISDYEFPCSLLSDELVNSTGHSSFGMLVQHELVFHNNSTAVVVS